MKNPFPSIKNGCLTFFGWVHTAICALTTEDGRKGWAMLAALGCCVIETALVVIVLWLVRKNPMLAFWIGFSSQATILIVITGLMWLLGVRRDTEIDLKEGKIKTSDAAVAQAVTPTVVPPSTEAPKP